MGGAPATPVIYDSLYSIHVPRSLNALDKTPGMVQPTPSVITGLYQGYIHLAVGFSSVKVNMCQWLAT